MGIPLPNDPAARMHHIVRLAVILSLTSAAFLSARNDVLANIAIVGAGILTTYTRSTWPD